MPRYRKLHTKIVESYDFNEMPDDFTRLFWVLLPLQCSRDGTLPYDSTLIRSKVFPLRSDVGTSQITDALTWFAKRGMLQVYAVDGRQYLWLTNFAKYQGTTTKEAESDYPPPPTQSTNHSRVSPELVQSKSSTDAVCNMQMQYADADASALDARKNGDGDTVATPPGNGRTEATRAWELARGGSMNALDAEQLVDLIDEFTDKWVTDAIHEANASRNGKLISFNFVRAILDRWKAEGYKAPRGDPVKRADADADKREKAQITRKIMLEQHRSREDIDAAILEYFGPGY